MQELVDILIAVKTIERFVEWKIHHPAFEN